MQLASYTMTSMKDCMMNDLTRRTALAGLVGALALAATPTFALSTGEARALINEVVAKINSVINFT